MLRFNLEIKPSVNLSNIYAFHVNLMYYNSFVLKSDNRYIVNDEFILLMEFNILWKHIVGALGGTLPM